MPTPRTVIQSCGVTMLMSGSHKGGLAAISPRPRGQTPRSVLWNVNLVVLPGPVSGKTLTSHDLPSVVAGQLSFRHTIELCLWLLAV
jgi:hypothetical protein